MKKQITSIMVVILCMSVLIGCGEKMPEQFTNKVVYKDMKSYAKEIENTVKSVTDSNADSRFKLLFPYYKDLEDDLLVKITLDDNKSFPSKNVTLSKLEKQMIINAYDIDFKLSQYVHNPDFFFNIDQLKDSLETFTELTGIPINASVKELE